MPKIDARYREYVALRLRLYRLIEEGADESAREPVDDELIEKWEGLDESQRISLHGVGADLSWVLRRGAPPPRSRQRKDVPSDGWGQLNKALSTRDWHALLYYLRECSPVLSTITLVYCRESCYDGIGLPAVAQVFARFRQAITVEQAKTRAAH